MLEVAGVGAAVPHTFKNVPACLPVLSPEARLPPGPRGKFTQRECQARSPQLEGWARRPGWQQLRPSKAAPQGPGFQEQLFPVSLEGRRRKVEMNLRGKGSVSQAKIPLEWADVRSAGQVPAQCGCEGGRKGVWGQGEETYVSICGKGSGHTRPGTLFPAPTVKQSTLFHSIPQD